MIPGGLNAFFRYFFLPAAVFFRCAEAPVGASETTSGVEIAVIETTVRGTTASGATVMLFNKDYSSAGMRNHSDTAVADDTGFFDFTGLPADTYNLFVFVNSTKSAGAVLQNIRIEPINGVKPYADTGAFSALRTIAGTVSLQQQRVPGAQVFIPGSPFSTETDPEGVFSFTGVPEGTYSVVVPPVRSWNGGGDSLPVDFTMTDEPTVFIEFDLKQ